MNIDVHPSHNEMLNGSILTHITYRPVAGNNTTFDVSEKFQCFNKIDKSQYLSGQRIKFHVKGKHPYIVIKSL